MGTWGNTVCIKLDPDGQYISLNAHLNTITVKEGQKVAAGQQIGTNGGTNHSGSNYACHIHYEIQHNNGSAPWRGDLWGDPEEFYLDQHIVIEYSDKFKNNDIIYNITNINIRQSPSINSKIVGQISPKETCQIVTNSQNGIKVGDYYWWKINKGWIAEYFFNKKAIETSNKFDIGDIITNVTASHVRIREKPSLTATIKGTVSPQDSVTIMQHESNGIKSDNYYWWYIGTGWVVEKFFSVVKDKYQIILNDLTLTETNNVTNILKEKGYSPIVNKIKEN